VRVETSLSPKRVNSSEQASAAAERREEVVENNRRVTCAIEWTEGS
jgi:hypothetical protein